MSALARSSLWMPAHSWGLVPPTLVAVAMTATGHKIACYGRLDTHGLTGKSIRNISLRTGTVVEAGGSDVTVTIENVDLANGPVPRPDGTPLASVLIDQSADATYASSTFFTTGNLDADLAVDHGDLLAVVLTWSNYGGADSLALNSTSVNSGSIRSLLSGMSTFNGSAWADGAAAPNILFTHSDGTFSNFLNCFPWTALTTTAAFNVDTVGADERGLEFQVSHDGTIDAAWFLLNFASGANTDIVLYDGSNNVLWTVTLDANAIRATGAGEICTFPVPETALTRLTTYRMVAKPTTTNNITIYEPSVAAAAHWDCWPGGQAWKHCARVGAGAWTTTPTLRAFAGLRFSQVVNEVEVGGGGGGIPPFMGG